MVHINGLTFAYGGRTLMDGLALHVRPGDRLGLVGPNGAGKTTLMRIISGEIVEGCSGAVTRRKGVAIGLLPQDGVYDSGRTVMESALEPFAEVLALKREMEKLNSAIAAETGDTARAPLLQRLGECQSEFETRGGFTCRAEAARTLTGLGFHEEDFDRDVGTFSGGWQMRIALAKLLLRNADILLLDEPTNHLDLPALIWFENFLQTFPGALVVISHDRNFLDRVVRRIAEFNQRKLDLYTGGYSAYADEKQKRMEILLNRIENQQREIRQTERFIERFRYKSTKARQVQSRIKALEKLERIDAPASERELKFTFRANRPSGKMVMRLENVSKSYGDKRVLTNVNMTVSKGDRIAVIGANGLGKSTLMRVIAGRTEFTGERSVGHNVSIGYFSQDQYELLNPAATVLEEASRAAGDGFTGGIRSILGVFLFSGGDVEKKVGVLSGGEKSRLLLSRLMADPANFLILDEPTSHLDPPSREMLECVLNDYDGTICLVSHDRYFINAVATRVIDLSAAGIDEYLGNYSDYESARRERERLGLVADDDAKRSRAAVRSNAAAEKKAAKRERATFIAERSRALTPIRNAVRDAEQEIESLEARIADIEGVLSDPATYSDAEMARTLPAELKSKKDRLETVIEKWEELSEQLAETAKRFTEQEQSIPPE